MEKNIAELAKKMSTQYGLKIDPMSILITGFTSFAGIMDNGETFLVTYIPDKFMMFSAESFNPEVEVEKVLEKLISAVDGLKPFVKYQESDGEVEINTYEWDWEDVPKRIKELEKLVEEGVKKNVQLL
jgi:hypothetical protein